MRGTLIHHPDFGSRCVAPRRIDVWLPSVYHEQAAIHLPVVYLHDGQNLFSAETSFIGVDWGMDDAMNTLMERRRPAIAVGIWNIKDRFLEYLPEKPIAAPQASGAKALIEREYGGPPLSDVYLKFITEELKPFIDATYRTLPGRSNTFIMGSSMGALVSLYAVCEYPDVFAGAACLSTHWPALGDSMLEYMAVSLPRPGSHRIYFDYGTETLDAPYEPYQKRVDAVMRRSGYEEGKDWVTLKFAGAEHSERSWRERVSIPLSFLLGMQAMSVTPAEPL